jgi:hypothetical protein
VTSDEQAPIIYPLDNQIQNQRTFAMIKSEAARIISRRLNLPLGRVNALLVAASDAGVLPKGSGKHNPSLSTLELVYVVLACIADRGIGVAGQSVREFARLQTVDGLVLADFLESAVSGRINPANLKSAIFRLSPATVTIASGSHHLIFGGAGAEDAAARTVLVPGTQLAGICLELQGMKPEAADHALAVNRLSAALH